MCLSRVLTWLHHALCHFNTHYTLYSAYASCICLLWRNVFCFTFPAVRIAKRLISTTYARRGVARQDLASRGGISFLASTAGNEGSGGDLSGTDAILAKHIH